MLTTGNPADLWGLPNLQSAFDVEAGEETSTGDVFRHYQIPAACEGLSTTMPDCSTASMMDRCIKRHYPGWKGMGSLPPGWEALNDNTCIKNDQRIREAYEKAVADDFQIWMIERQQPYVGIGIVASGYKCRADYDSVTGLVQRDRSDLMTVFTESNFKMPNNHTCSTFRCDTCRCSEPNPKP